MKSEFLKKLGLEDGVIDQIMRENENDIEAEKAKSVAKEMELKTANKTIKDLQDAVKKFEGKDPATLESDLKALQIKYDEDISALKLSRALDVALMGAKVRDPISVKPHLNLDLVKLDGDKVLGLEEQLKNIKETKGYLFEEEQKAETTGMSHQGGTEGTSDKKEEANAAFRSLFGKE